MQKHSEAQATHTPHKWEQSHRGIISKWGNRIAVCETGSVGGAEGSHIVTEVEAIANAAYIVQACNLFPKMIEALESVMDESHASDCTYRNGHAAECNCFKATIGAILSEIEDSK